MLRSLVHTIWYRSCSRLGMQAHASTKCQRHGRLWDVGPCSPAAAVRASVHKTKQGTRLAAEVMMPTMAMSAALACGAKACACSDAATPSPYTAHCRTLASRSPQPASRRGTAAPRYLAAPADACTPG